MPSSITLAMRCLYGSVSSDHDIRAMAAVLVDRNHGFEPSDAISIEELSGLQLSGWQCVSTYPESEPCCPFCRGRDFAWEDGDMSVYSGDGKCRSCNADISIHGVEELA